MTLSEILSGKKRSVLYEFHDVVTYPSRPMQAWVSLSPGVCISPGSLNQFPWKSGRVVQNANKTDGTGRQDRTNSRERDGGREGGADEKSAWISTRSKFRKRCYLGDKLSAKTFIPGRPAAAAASRFVNSGWRAAKNGTSLKHAPRNRVLMILKHLWSSPTEILCRIRVF